MPVDKRLSLLTGDRKLTFNIYNSSTDALIVSYNFPTPQVFFPDIEETKFSYIDGGFTKRQKVCGYYNKVKIEYFPSILTSTQLTNFNAIKEYSRQSGVYIKLKPSTDVSFTDIINIQKLEFTQEDNNNNIVGVKMEVDFITFQTDSTYLVL